MIFEIIGFTFEFEPYIAINGDLKKPVKVLESAEGFSMKFDGGLGMLKAREACPIAYSSKPALMGDTRKTALL